MKRNTYVLGHKNPDADSICAAIAYADFKQQTDDHYHFIPARCGNSNARIDAILRQFNVPLPLFVGDLSPRVKDIMIENVVTVKNDATCAEALELIDEYDVRVLPVVTDSNHVSGILTVFHLGEFFIPKPATPKQMRHVHTTVNSIIRSLKAEVFHVVDGDVSQDFFVRVGAMDVRSFGRFTQEEPEVVPNTIVVVGDRWDIQQKCIQMGIRLLIISGNLEIAPEVVSLAREKGVSLIRSSLDTATTSWIVRAATIIDKLVSRKYQSFAPEEKLNEVRRKISTSNASAFLVVSDENRLMGIFTKTDFLKPVKTRIILVDHNEISQAVNGADQVEIAEILDHHRLNNPPSSYPVLFLNEPVGSTCTIIADLYRREGLTPRPEIAGLMMSGIISDTLNLNSPTTTDKDARLLDWLQPLAKIKTLDLANLIFNSGSVILSVSPAEVIRTDYKIYEESDLRFSASQVEELGFANFWKYSQELLDALDDLVKEESLYFAVLLVTDINTHNSLLVIRGERSFIESISYPAVEPGQIYDLPGVVSRKKQLIPYLTSLLEIDGGE